ncbi:MAG: hypothetical protein M3444_07300, partial [Acidobacteriota bacterium]|nr:hypothetical protein [Acidobacteriota bacterium]
PAAQLHVAGTSAAANSSAAAPDALLVAGGAGGSGNWSGGAGGAGGAIRMTGGAGGTPVAGGAGALGGGGGDVNLTGGTGGGDPFGAGGGNGGNIVLNGGQGASGRNGNVLLASVRGNVGIGTPTPAVKLDINAGSNTAVAINATGAINSSGAITGATINAVFQDVAEWVPSTQKLQAGTVVVLDTNKTNHVLASTKAYDTGVAGVVSDNPGVILGQGGGDRVKVATTGRVKVKVDATRAPIKVGDLLVTGEAEGVAMKSVPVDLGGVQIHRPGTIIGKALEPLAGGTGEILVLLSLQ